MNNLFPTQEVGSLAKPRWRVKGYQGIPLSNNEINDAINWGKKLKIREVPELIKMLKQTDSPSRKNKLMEWSARYALKFFEEVGLDIIYDGEQWRSEMYESAIKKIGGFEFLGWVKSFDYRYFNKAACVQKPTYLKSLYLDEFLFTKKYAKKPVKIPFTGAYTLVEWTFNEYYERKNEAFNQGKFEAKQEFLFDLIKNVLRPEIQALIQNGAKWIQIDEPAATTNPTDEEMRLFVDSFNETVKGFNCTFSIHNCFSDYKVLAKYSGELKNCDQLSLEFSNRDSLELGIGDNRSGYREINYFEESGFQGSYGLGVVDVHTNFIEPPELIRDRILHAAKLVNDSNRIYVSPDCGLRTRTWAISYSKIQNMILGTQMARNAVK